MDSREIILWIDERWYNALSKHLKNETVEDRLDEYLDAMISQLPNKEHERISREIWEENERMRKQQEAERKLAVFHVKQNSKTECFETSRPFEFLNVANNLRSYLRGQPVQRFASTLGGRSDLTDEAFEEYVDERMVNSGRVTGAFKIDLDKGTIAALHITDGWQMFLIKDVSTAAYHAMRKTNLSWERRFKIFADHLNGKEFSPLDAEKPDRFLRGERTLRAEDIQFAERIEPMGNHLNFCMNAGFDVDAVFGMHVCTDENGDYMSVYANYDIETQRVCDTLGVVLVGKDRDEAYVYRLNDEEKTYLLSKMEAYVQQMNGETLADCVARYQLENEQEETASGDMIVQGWMAMQGGML